MNINVYAVKDAKVGAFLQPFYSQTHGSAIRAFADHCADNTSMPNKHPEDFALYYVGAFDDQIGKLQAVDPQLLANASEYANVTAQRS